MTTYLIDYDNVHEGGMVGVEQLGEGDSLVLFFSENTPKINLNILAKANTLALRFIPVSPGRQNADMVLVSQLGYLIGAGKGKEYAIISADAGYAPCAAWWMDADPSLRIAVAPTIAQAVGNARPAPGQIPEELRRELNAAGVEDEAIAFVVSQTRKSRGQPNNLAIIYRETVKRYGQKRGTVIYNAAKKNLIKQLLK